MADLTALPGVRTTITGSDTLTVSFPGLSPNGAIVEASGFTLNNCTIQAKGAVSDYETVAATGCMTRIGSMHPVQSIKISSVTGTGPFVIKISN
jgi:hypothetical protein